MLGENGVSLIVVVVTMLVFAVLGVLVTSIVSSDSDVSLSLLQSQQAFYLAEAGREYGIRQIVDSPPLAGCPAAFLSLTTGDFQVCDADAGPAVRVQGTGRVTSPIVTTSQRVVQAEYGAGGSTEALTDGDFEDTPNEPTNWPETLTRTDGQSLYDPAPPAPVPSGAQALRAENNLGAGFRFQGYREQTLGTMIPTGTNVTLSLYFRKIIAGSTAGSSRADIAIELVPTAGGPIQIWSDTTQPPGDSGWIQTGLPLTTTTTKDIVGVRVTYNLINRGGGAGAGSQKQVWFDAVSLTYPGATGVSSWQDVYN